MTDEKNLPAQDAETDEKPVQQETPQPQAAKPASETQAEEWDQERAMETIRNLRAIEKKYKADTKELERLKAEEQKRLEAQMSETERLQKQNEELAQKAKQLEDSMLRRDVIAEVGLPPAFADRLKGSNKDEMLADAKSLLELLPKKQPAQSVTNPGGAKTEQTLEQMRAELMGTNQNIFSDDMIKQKGGGVGFITK